MNFARDQGKYEFTIINDDLERAKSETEQVIRSNIDPR